MPADLTARIRAKLDEVRHAEDCNSRWRPYPASTTDPCSCDRPQRVADLVRRMIEVGIDHYLCTPEQSSAMEAALAVPSEEENRG